LTAASGVKSVIAGGEVIAEYPGDSPYPSCLMLRFVKDRPIHVVVASDEDDRTCVVVTVYVPGLDQWQPDFRTRREK